MPILYAAELALGEEDVRPFLDWYAYRHVPDLFACGFSVCSCYRAIEGDMKFLDLYKLPGRDVLAQPGYTRLGSRDGYAAAVLDKRIDKSNTLYLQRAVAPAGFGGDRGRRRNRRGDDRSAPGGRHGCSVRRRERARA